MSPARAEPAERQLPECTRLAAALRELRSHSGLSLAALAVKTPYSKSSWERYLNGKTLPPRHAVEALCRAAGEPTSHPLALWDLAETAWSGRARAEGRSTGIRSGDSGSGSGSDSDSGPGPGRVRFRGASGRPVMLTALGAGVCGTVFALVLLLWPSPSREEGAAKEGAKTVAGCHGESCTGRDPVRMLCGAGKAPRTLRTVRVSGRLLDIRFQRECGAAWVRMWGQKVGDRVEVRVPGTAPQVETIDDGYETGQRRSTPMVPVQARDAEPVRACLVPREGERTCFVAHV